METRDRIAELLDDPWFCESLFDKMADVVFFVKDAEGRYAVVNDTLVHRSGLSSKDDLIGRRPGEVFPGEIAEHYERQDQEVLRGTEKRDELELHLYRDRSWGWCMTDKVPLRTPGGEVVGLAGISRDLQAASEDQAFRRVAEVVTHCREHLDEPLRVQDLAVRASMSVAQFERKVRRIFGVTPKQLVIKTRIEAASQLLLETDRGIAEIAHACGYADHSAFSRQFNAVVGLTPSAFRQSTK